MVWRNLENQEHLEETQLVVLLELLHQSISSGVVLSAVFRQVENPGQTESCRNHLRSPEGS